MEAREVRISDNAHIGIEERADGKQYLSYYAIVFDKLSRNMGGWYERIKRSAVDGADFTEWVAKKNHDPNLLLGTSWAKTATYEIDDTGVKARVLVGDTTIWQDTVKEAKRGDLNFASFEFQTATGGVEWLNETRGDNITIDVREIRQFSKIWDLSPVVTPAYPDTKGVSIAKREHEQIVNQRELDQKNEATETVVLEENKEEASVGESIELLMAIAEC